MIESLSFLFQFHSASLTLLLSHYMNSFQFFHEIDNKFLRHFSSNSILHLNHHTKFWSTLISSIFQFKIKLNLWKEWWIACLQSVILFYYTWIHTELLKLMNDSQLFQYFLSLILGIPCISDCVMAELEKLGPKFRLALK